MNGSGELTSVADLMDVIRDHEYELMFRGQSRDWPLLPSIGRFNCSGYSHWRVFHEHVIERFVRLGHPYFVQLPSTDMERWVCAQHHGLPTRLLDTTLNPLKAMYFVVGDPREDTHDGVLWLFSYDGWRENLDEKHRTFWDQEISAFLPAQIHPRLTAQEGAFICYPLPANTDPLPALDQLPFAFAGPGNVQCHKFFVQGSIKQQIRQELKRLGARHSLLFPDLDGVAREVTYELLDNVSSAPITAKSSK